MPRVDTHNVLRRGPSTYGSDITYRAHAPYNDPGRVSFYTFIGLLVTAECVSFVAYPLFRHEPRGVARERVHTKRAAPIHPKWFSSPPQLHHRHTQPIYYHIPPTLRISSLFCYSHSRYPITLSESLSPFPPPPIYNSYNNVHPFSPAYAQPRFFHESSSCSHFVNTIGPRPKRVPFLDQTGPTL